METYFDSRVDLLQRRLQKQTDQLKRRAQEVVKGYRSASGEPIAENFDREVQKMKLKVIPLFAVIPTDICIDTTRSR
jgi:hypothetical protein